MADISTRRIGKEDWFSSQYSFFWLRGWQGSKDIALWVNVSGNVQVALRLASHTTESVSSGLTPAIQLSPLSMTMATLTPLALKFLRQKAGLSHRQDAATPSFFHLVLPQSVDTQWLLPLTYW